MVEIIAVRKIINPIEAKMALATALAGFSGTVLLISHDRDFIEHIANRIFFLSHKQ
jgi:ATPase subunit of ABC transporter with duplicated ATPase domains